MITHRSLIEGIVKLASRAKFSDFFVGSIFCKVTYPFGHRRFAKNRIQRKKRKFGTEWSFAIPSILMVLLASSCSLREQMAQTAFLSGSDRRQKQRVVVLQKKLDQAHKALAKSQEEVDLLQLQLCDAQLESIEQQIGHLERKWQTDPVSLSQALYQDASHLFLEERETLYRILQTGFSMHRAQNLIDRILQLITQINDCAVRTP